MKKTIAFDFDGVISTYNGFKGVDVFGAPIKETIDTIKQLKKEGYYIIIFTTRLDTPKLREWLKRNDVKYDDINRNINQPPHTSIKPVYHCIIDDRAINFNLRIHRMSSNALLKEIRRIVNEATK
ncbi:MAG: hypothetical protein ACFFAU_01335 [Candidatus Hodarchaeota archaeon]